MDLPNQPRLDDEYIVNFKPEVVFEDHAGVINIGDLPLHEAVVTASRPIPGAAC